MGRISKMKQENILNANKRLLEGHNRTENLKEGIFDFFKSKEEKRYQELKQEIKDKFLTGEEPTSEDNNIWYKAGYKVEDATPSSIIFDHLNDDSIPRKLDDKIIKDIETVLQDAINLKNNIKEPDKQEEIPQTTSDDNKLEELKKEYNSIEINDEYAPIKFGEKVTSTLKALDYIEQGYEYFSDLPENKKILDQYDIIKHKLVLGNKIYEIFNGLHEKIQDSPELFRYERRKEVADGREYFELSNTKLEKKLEDIDSYSDNMSKPIQKVIDDFEDKYVRDGANIGVFYRGSVHGNDVIKWHSGDLERDYDIDNYLSGDFAKKVGYGSEGYFSYYATPDLSEGQSAIGYILMRMRKYIAKITNQYRKEPGCEEYNKHKIYPTVYKITLKGRYLWEHDMSFRKEGVVGEFGDIQNINPKYIESFYKKLNIVGAYDITGTRRELAIFDIDNGIANMEVYDPEYTKNTLLQGNQTLFSAVYNTIEKCNIQR